MLNVEYTGTNASNIIAVRGKSAPQDHYGYGGLFVGGFVGVTGEVYPTGSHAYYGVKGYVDGGSGTNYGVFGSAAGIGSTNWAGYFGGNVHVSGTLSKNAGSFKIDHPLDPENKWLLHSFVESPDMMNIYNGNIITDADGYSTVELPEYFDALNMDFRYQLTVIGEFAQAIIAKEIEGNRFEIRTDKPNVKVSWQVTGVRKDAYANAYRIQVEVDKKSDEQGKYSNPEAFGLDETMSIDYEHMQKLRNRRGEENDVIKNIDLDGNRR